MWSQDGGSLTVVINGLVTPTTHVSLIFSGYNGITHTFRNLHVFLVLGSKGINSLVQIGHWAGVITLIQGVIPPVVALTQQGSTDRRPNCAVQNYAVPLATGAKKSCETV